MIQKGDDLINGGSSQNYLCHQISPRNSFVGNVAVQVMSFEDVLSQCERTLPPVETVLPQYAIPTPPPSCSPSAVNMINTNTNHMFQYNNNVYNESNNIQSTSGGRQLFNVDHNL